MGKPLYLERFERLREKFDEKPFSTAEAQRVLSLTPAALYKLMYTLVRKRLAAPVGRGFYRLSKGELPALSPSVSEKGVELRAPLIGEGLNFFITGLDLLVSFAHHLPVRFPHLVYVEREALAWAEGVLTAKGFRVLLNPHGEQLSIGLSLVGGADLVILRETANFYATKEGYASIERALVDLYFEVSREHYPVPTMELGRIFFNVLRFGPVSFTRLMRCASRRQIEGEVRAILKGLSRKLPIPAKICRPSKKSTSGRQQQQPASPNPGSSRLSPGIWSSSPSSSSG